MPSAPWLIAGFVMLTSLVSVSTLSDAATAGPVPYARPTQPLAYLLFAPLYGMWDTLSLLTLSQDYAVLVTLVALYLAWRVAVAGRRKRAGARPDRDGTVEGEPPRALGRRVAGEAGLAVASVLGLLSFLVVCMLVPRPMTGIAIDDPELVAIDFHSHTNRSHDGWGLFTAPRNRKWHEAGGFHVAFVTDHYTWRGFDEAVIDNPVSSGERTVLLEGAEIRIHRRPTNVLGRRDRYLGALDADSVYMDPDSIGALAARIGRPSTMLYTMPGGLQYVVPYTDETPSGVIGIEINDGSPRGLEQVRSQRAEILALADSMDLAILGAANLHGWGRTVASWSVMRIPGWRDMTPEELGDTIERDLHAYRRQAVEVVERRMPYHGGSPVRVALTLPWITLEHFRMLTWAERVSWLGWIGVWLAGAQVVARRRGKTEGGATG